MFSFGVVLYELLARDKPISRFPKNNFGYCGSEFIDSITAKTKDEAPPAELLKMALDCVNYAPDQRPTFKDCANVLKQLRLTVSN